MSTYRSFKLRNASDLQALQRHSEQLAQEWGQQWLLDAAMAAPVCVDAHAYRQDFGDMHSLAWTHYAADRPRAHIGVSLSEMRAFALLAFGSQVNHFDATSTQPSDLLGEVFQLALRDLARRFCARAGMDEAALEGLIDSLTAPEDDLWLKGTGAVAVEIALGSSTVRVLLPGLTVDALLKDHLRPTAMPAILVAPRECVSSQKVNMQCWAGEVTLELGVLQSLAVGDVIRLDARIQDPMSVTLSGKRVRLNGYLGKLENRKAVQLVTS